jgi:catechol 2,3-dioxygenase-like lactoylglutathione lyase family enzyme
VKWGTRVAEHDVGWWEIEMPNPDRTRGFYAALFGWEFHRAFDEPATELGRRYWVVQRAGEGSESFRSPCRPHRRRRPGYASMFRWTTSKGRCHEPVELGGTRQRDRTYSEPTTSGSRTCETPRASLWGSGPAAPGRVNQTTPRRTRTYGRCWSVCSGRSIGGARGHRQPAPGIACRPS